MCISSIHMWFKATLMNKQRCRIRKLMFYELELCHKSAAAIKKNLQIWWVVFGDYQASSATYTQESFVSFMTSAKASRAAELCLTLPKYCKTFDSLEYILTPHSWVCILWPIGTDGERVKGIGDVGSPSLLLFIHLRVFFFTPALADGFHWSLSDSKSLQVFRTLLSILVDLNNAVVWMSPLVLLAF